MPFFAAQEIPRSRKMRIDKEKMGEQYNSEMAHFRNICTRKPFRIGGVYCDLHANHCHIDNQKNYSHFVASGVHTANESVYEARGYFHQNESIISFYCLNWIWYLTASVLWYFASSLQWYRPKTMEALVFHRMRKRFKLQFHRIFEMWRETIFQLL